MHADIIILAAIAIFVILRVRGVLGQKTGHFPTPDSLKEVKKEDERVVRLEHARKKAQETLLLPGEDDAGIATPSDALEGVPEPLHSAVQKAQELDKDFRMPAFLEGAKAAFEMILTAFGRHDKKSLKPLLNQATFDAFSQEIDAQKSKGHVHVSTLVAINQAEPVAVEIDKHLIRITVFFTTEQVHLIKDTGGEIVEGDPSDIDVMEDRWTFERDSRSSNPNWTLVST